MPESEIARLRQNIAAEYMAAKWGLTGLQYGASQHQFITAKMVRMQEYHQELRDQVGEQATRMVVETIESLPEQATRAGIIEVVRHTLGDEQETARVIGRIQDLWRTLDQLVQRFGQEDAHKIVGAVDCMPPVIKA
jgi:hypothetical protein